MIVYWLLLILTALIAYLFGSLDSVIIASNLLFHRDLRRLGAGNLGLSNFRRIYGARGFIRLLIVEIVKDVLPVLIGGWLLGIRGHAEAGRAFAGFCLVLGRLYPAIYGFKGSHGLFCLAVSAIIVNSSTGIAMALFSALGIWLSRYVSLGTVLGAAVYIILAFLMIDDSLIMTLGVLSGALVLIKHIPAVSRLINGKEEKLSLKEDISYKFDEKF